MKIFLIRSQSLELSEFLDSEGIWSLFDDVETFPEAVCGVARYATFKADFLGLDQEWM
jgi:hypothetical protein